MPSVALPFLPESIASVEMKAAVPHPPAPSSKTGHKTYDQAGEDLLQKYLETLAHAPVFQLSNARHWTLLQCYAEVEFILHGGARCPVCNAHVRHVLPVRAEHNDGTHAEFSCLCTRCFEAERAISRVVVIHVGQARVEHYPINYGAKTTDRRGLKPPLKAARKTNKA